MPNTYQLRIELRHIKPTIYRDVLVDPSITLRKLHKVIQAAMGWEDCHLYGFALPHGSASYWRIARGRKFEPPQADDWSEPANNDIKYKISDVLRAPKDKLLYMYDFGDDWEHSITLKAVVEVDAPLPHLIKAQNGCPPEDVGGVSGAAHWASIWYDKTHEEHEIALQIFGAQEPNWLDFAALQKAVKKLQPKPKKINS